MKLLKIIFFLFVFISLVVNLQFNILMHGFDVLRPNATSKKESALQREFESLFKEKKSCVVYLSSTNIDRLFSLYHAALKAGRPFYVDKYQKDIMDVVVNSQSMWSKSSLYQYGKNVPEALMYHKFDKNRFFVSDSFKEFLNEKGYVIIARGSDRFDDLLEHIPGEKQKVLSMWNGYVKEGTKAYNENLANSLEGEYDYMHTSGHIDMKDLREFFHQLQPKALIPHPSNRFKVQSSMFNVHKPSSLSLRPLTLDLKPLTFDL